MHFQTWQGSELSMGPRHTGAVKERGGVGEQLPPGGVGEGLAKDVWGAARVAQGEHCPPADSHFAGGCHGVIQRTGLHATSPISANMAYSRVGRIVGTRVAEAAARP